MFLCNYILCICIVQSRLEIVRIVYSSAIDSKRSVSCMFANVMVSKYGKFYQIKNRRNASLNTSCNTANVLVI